MTFDVFEMEIYCRRNLHRSWSKSNDKNYRKTLIPLLLRLDELTERYHKEKSLNDVDDFSNLCQQVKNLTGGLC